MRNKNTIMKLSFRKQIMCMTFVLFAVFISVLYFTSQKILTKSLSEQFLAQTNSLTELVRTTMKPAVLAEDIPAITTAAQAILAFKQVHYIQVFSYDHALLELDSSEYPTRQFSPDDSLVEPDDGFYDTTYLLEIDGKPVGEVQLSFSIDEVRAELLSAERKLVANALVVMVFGLWGIWLLAGRLSARIKALEQATHQFAAGKKDISLPLKGNDEIAATGRAFKSMMWQIREKYEAINLSPDGILLVSSNHRINHTNTALVSILGERAEHLTGKPFGEFKRMLLDVLDRKRHPHIRNFEELLTLPEFTVDVPELKVLRCVRKRVDSPDGKGASEVFYFRDVTQETEVDRMKSEFLNTAAHELRTPLASVMGFSELLMHNNYGVDTVKMLAETINRQSVNLKHLVDNLLDIARIEARGGDVIDLSLVTAKNIVDECCDNVASNDNPCVLIYDNAQCAWPLLMLDENKIKQALMNILTNAVKYSGENGRVVVDTIQLTDEFDVDWFGLRVTDEGIGMSQEQLARVGEKFYRADNAGSIPGTGLGVALTSEILALHDGHIEITSQLGQGTQVTLWIPVAEQLEQKMQAN